MTEAQHNSPTPAPERAQQDKKAIYAAGQWRLAWRKFRRNRIALVGAVMLLLLYLGALFSGFIAPY